jgi:DNA-binding NarL/FixJ family response regulator
MTGAIRVLVVDDHAIVVQGLVRLMAEFPGVTVVGVAPTAKAALEALEAGPADVVLLDQMLPDEPGLDLVSRLRSRHPRTAVVMLSGAFDADLERDALEAGCAGALSKAASVDEIVAAVRAAAATVDPELGKPTKNGRLGLTNREMEVLVCISRGMSSKEISAELHLANHTVRNYTQKVLNRLGARSKAEAVAIASRHGIVHVAGQP